MVFSKCQSIVQQDYEDINQISDLYMLIIIIYVYYIFNSLTEYNCINDDIFL